MSVNNLLKVITVDACMYLLLNFIPVPFEMTEHRVLADTAVHFKGLYLFTYLKVKGKGRYSSSWEPHLIRATGCHLPWDHTVLPATDPTQVNTPRLTPCRPVLDLRTPERWKAELT